MSGNGDQIMSPMSPAELAKYQADIDTASKEDDDILNTDQKELADLMPALNGGKRRRRRKSSKSRRKSRKTKRKRRKSRKTKKRRKRRR